jgi:hypothetical protein
MQSRADDDTAAIRSFLTARQSAAERARTMDVSRLPALHRCHFRTFDPAECAETRSRAH